MFITPEQALQAIQQIMDKTVRCPHLNLEEIADIMRETGYHIGEEKAEGTKAYEVTVLWRTTEVAEGSIVVHARSPDEAMQAVRDGGFDIDFGKSEIIDGDHEILSVEEVKP